MSHIQRMEASMTMRVAAESRPAPGEAIEIAPGILWASIPLPFRLNHVNIWFLEEPDGWTAIDCGIDSDDVRAVWERLMHGPLGGRPLRRLLATHGHTDHVGLAGYLVERHGVPFVASLAEWLWARLRFAERDAVKPAAESFFARHGCSAEMIGEFRSHRGGIVSTMGPHPEAFVRMRDGEMLWLGGRQWRVIVGGGHSDEHCSLYCASDNLLIAGDQILPRISPVVGVYPTEPDADPLGDYLASLPRFAALPEDALVLPGHGLPFVGLHTRVDELQAHHAKRLDALGAMLDRPQSAAAAAAQLFARAVAEGHGRLALAETLAHLHRLVAQGRVVRHSDGAVITFARNA